MNVDAGIDKGYQYGVSLGGVGGAFGDKSDVCCCLVANKLFHTGMKM